MPWYAYLNLVLFPLVLGLVTAFGTAYVVRRNIAPRLAALEQGLAELHKVLTDVPAPGDVLTPATATRDPASTVDPHAAYRRPRSLRS